MQKKMEGQFLDRGSDGWLKMAIKIEFLG